MKRVARACAVAITAGVVSVIAGCAAGAVNPAPPQTVGENYPGTCMPSEFSWPTDFLEALPSESAAVGGRVVGLRLEYLAEQWVWRIRSAASATDVWGERVDDPSVGMESIVDVRTLEVRSSADATLTEAEQSDGTGALAAAMATGEQWPSPLIVEMTREMHDGAAVWRITTCDTATAQLSEQTIP
nr:hypothetical protein [Microbacterium hydrocarbonoxydans]